MTAKPLRQRICGAAMLYWYDRAAPYRLMEE
jgi:hypothetical protein